MNIIGLTIIDNFRNGLDIYFIDVGQGDSTLIITENNKRILIDGGGKETFNNSEDGNQSSFDVGEDILLPYLLDRRINNLDYIIVSHFDTDHCGGLIAVLENIKVSAVIISKQLEKTKQFDNFIELVRIKKIKCLTVKTGDRVNLDKYTFFDILSSTDAGVKENQINNNSIVCRLNYGNFSMLFTGDIEKEAEQHLVGVYDWTRAQSFVPTINNSKNSTSWLEIVIHRSFFR